MNSYAVVGPDEITQIYRDRRTDFFENKNDPRRTISEEDIERYRIFLHGIGAYIDRVVFEKDIKTWIRSIYGATHSLDERSLFKIQDGQLVRPDELLRTDNKSSSKTSRRVMQTMGRTQTVMMSGMELIFAPVNMITSSMGYKDPQILIKTRSYVRDIMYHIKPYFLPKYLFIFMSLVLGRFSYIYNRYGRFLVNILCNENPEKFPLTMLQPFDELIKLYGLDITLESNTVSPLHATRVLKNRSTRRNQIQSGPVEGTNNRSPSNGVGAGITGNNRVVKPPTSNVPSEEASPPPPHYVIQPPPRTETEGGKKRSRTKSSVKKVSTKRASKKTPTKRSSTKKTSTKRSTSTKKTSTKKATTASKKKPSPKKVKNPKTTLQRGGAMSFIKDIVLSGKDLINGNKQIFTGIKNLGTDIFCEAKAIKNLPKELDLGFETKCKFTKTKSWDPKMFEGR